MQSLLLIGLISFFSLQKSYGQTFLSLFGEPLDRTTATGMYQHPDSSIYVSGNALDTSNLNQITLCKFNQYGLEEWRYKIPASQSEYTFDMAYLNGYLYFFGRKDSSDGIARAFVKKTHLDGTEVWSKTIVNGILSSGFRGGSAWGNNGLVATGFINDTVHTNNNSYTINIDEQGNIIWEYELMIPNNNYAQELTVQGNDVYVVCDRQKADFAYSIIVESINTMGQVNWTDTVVTSYNTGSQNAFLKNGELFVVGETSTASSIQFDPILIKYDAFSGQRKSFHSVGLTANSEAAFDGVFIDETRLISCGYGHNPSNGSSDFMLVVMDTSGLVDQTRFYGNNEFDLATDAMRGYRKGTFFCGEQRQTGSKFGALLYFDEFGYNTISESSNPQFQIEAVSNNTIYLNKALFGSYQLYSIEGKLIEHGEVSGKTVFCQAKDVTNQIYMLRLLDKNHKPVMSHKISFR
jgi:hypothetical protein